MMRSRNHGGSLRAIDTLFNVGTVAGLTDAELLERFTTRGGEVAELAFSALLERHGPMVLRVCRRLLRDPHDAQDAFQAAFLVLIRKACAIRNRESLASWLYGVALRVASESRTAARRRQTRERKAARAEAVVPRHTDDSEVILEELERLPDQFRVAIVLCALEGYTCEEAARQLCWPIGTVRSRLARGKEQLRARLVRRGLAPTAGLLLATLAAKAEAVPIPLAAPLVRVAARVVISRTAAAGTVPAAVSHLTETVIRSMFMTKAKIIAGALIATGFLAAGAVVLAQSGEGAGSTESAQASPRIRYEIRVYQDGKPRGNGPIVVEMSAGDESRIETPYEQIHIRPRAASQASTVPTASQPEAAPKGAGAVGKGASAAPKGASAPPTGEMEGMMRGMMMGASIPQNNAPAPKGDEKNPAKGAIPPGAAARTDVPVTYYSFPATPTAKDFGQWNTKSDRPDVVPEGSSSRAQPKPKTPAATESASGTKTPAEQPGTATTSFVTTLLPDLKTSTGIESPTAFVTAAYQDLGFPVFTGRNTVDASILFQEHRLRELERKLDEIRKRLEPRNIDTTTAPRP